MAVGVLLSASAFQDAARARARLVATRATLQRAMNDPAALRTPESRTALIAEVDAALGAMAGARQSLLRSPGMSAMGYIPVLRAQRSGLLGLLDDSRSAAVLGRDLLVQVDGLAGRTQLRDGALPLDGLDQLQVQLRAGGANLAALVTRDRGLWGPLGTARREFDDLARSSSRRLLEGSDALGAARTFIGAGGSRRYLIALQNNAEMRDQGSVLSFAVVRFADGRFSFERRGSTITELSLTGPAPTPLPEGTRQVFGALQPTQLWPSVNASADFALSGRIMADMYRQSTGQAIDGVIGVDVPGLAALLRAVGPVSLSAVAEPITSDNVARVLLRDFYDGLLPGSDQTLRKERQGEVIQAMVDRLTSGTRDAVSLGREMGQAAAGGHLRLWSAVKQEEDVFERTGLGGGPATVDADRTFHVAVENRTATKLDYYVKSAIRQAIELTKLGTAIVRTTVSVDNQAPVTDKPSFQLGPDGIASKKPGDYLAWVLLWGPAGSRQIEGGVEESGLNLGQRVVGVGAAERKEVTFQTVIPNAVREGKLQIRLVPQARLDPMPAEVVLRAEGWRVTGSLTWKGVLDQVQTVAWRVSR